MKKAFIPPFVMLYCLIGIVAIYFLIPEYKILHFPFNLVGGFFIIMLGFSLAGRARMAFKEHNTTVKFEESSALVTDGIFAKSRNPMYLGMFCFLIGFAVFFRNAFGFIMPMLFIGYISIFVIPYEEKKNTETFGDEYLAYKRKVRRFF